TVLEGAGAAALAGALLPNLLRDRGLNGKKIVLVLCGGNIDLSVLNRVIERAFAADGRMCRVTCSIKDQPGRLVELCQIIAAAEGNVKQISHDRNFAPLDPSWVSSVFTIETRNHQHIEEIHRALQAAGISFNVG
ncbi:MAG: threonine ammonia-lyase, partial [Planctomycetota bacterium]